MIEPWGYMPSCAAEFPNDNPALHDGVSWVCLRVSGPPRPVTRPRGPSVKWVTPALVDRLPTNFAAPEGVSASVGTPSMELPPLSSVEPVVEPVAELAPSEDRLPESVLSALMRTLDLDLIAETATSVRAKASAVGESTLELEVTEGAESELSDDAPSSAVFAFDAEGGPAFSESHQQTLQHESSPPETAANEVDTTTKAEPAAPDAFAALVAALVEVALSAGATRAAAVLPDLLERGALDLGAFSDDIREGLIAARFVNASSGPTESFLAAASAWRQVLRGESADFSGCGPSTLDEWATALLKGFGVGQSGKTDVRRELRRRGVAAFGMLLAA